MTDIADKLRELQRIRSTRFDCHCPELEEAGPCYRCEVLALIPDPDAMGTLRKYVKHETECASWDPDWECNCGLAAALANLEEK